MKKSNKILSLITSSVLCTQVISVPMFAMKSLKSFDGNLLMQRKPKSKTKITIEQLNTRIIQLCTQIKETKIGRNFAIKNHQDVQQSVMTKVVNYVVSLKNKQNLAEEVNATEFYSSLMFIDYIDLLIEQPSENSIQAMIALLEGDDKEKTLLVCGVLNNIHNYVTNQ